MTAVCINEVRVDTVAIRLLEREHRHVPACLSTDYVMVATDARQPRAAAMAFLGYDMEAALRRFDRAVRIAAEEVA